MSTLIGTARQTFIFHPGLERAHLRQRLLRHLHGIAQRIDECQIIGDESLVAGHRTCPEECLCLPRLGPFRIVGLVGREAAHQRSVLALRTQIRVEVDALSTFARIEAR